MALRALLAPETDYRTGNFKWVARNIVTLTGLQEIEPGFLFCNGAIVPSSGKSAAGFDYAPLYTRLGTKYGASGQLPDFRDGKVPFGKGAGYALGAVGGEALHALTAGETPDHAHNITDYADLGGNVDGDPGHYGQFNGNGSGRGITRTTQDPGGGSGTAHENMPPVQVVGGVLIAL